jgi:hypothetical protein
MQKAVLITLLLCAAVMALSLVETGPTERVIPPWQDVWDEQTPADQNQIVTGNIVNNPGTDWAQQDAGGAGKPSEIDDPSWQHPAADWGTDILVGEPGRETSGRISVDNDASTGNIFVCMLNRDADVYDTAHIWQSTNGGVDWYYHLRAVGGTSQGHITDAQILCGHGPGDTTWLYFVEATTGAGLRIRRTTPDSAVFHWTTIDTSNSIVRVSLDRNIETPEHLFCTWAKSNGQVYIMSSTDAGETWGNRIYVASGRRDVCVAAGGDGYGYVAYMDTVDSTYYRVGRFQNNLVTPNWAFVDVDRDTTRRFREVAIAASRTSPGDSQVAIALTTCRHSNNNIDTHYSWTLNGGVSWDAGAWPVTNQTHSTWLARFPRIRRSYDSNLFRAIVSMPETTTSWDTIVYAYAYASDPATWDDRNVLNDYRNTGEVSHDVGYSNLTSGGFITYREYGSANVWFDGFSFTGVSAEPKPLAPGRLTTVFGGVANLVLPRRSPVKAAVYDQGGRLVRELFNGTMEPGQHRLDAGAADGVSFLRVTVGGQTETAKLVSLK